jgi:hypothetical protein
MMRTVVLLSVLALVASTLATDTRQSRYQKTKKRCKTSLKRMEKNGDDNGQCRTIIQFQSEFCDGLSESGCYVARKVSSEYYNGECCDEFECVLRDDNPCCGVSCQADSINEADGLCNIIHPNNLVWNGLSVHNGAMYAELLQRADPARGKCCDKFKCRTDYTALCEREVQVTPCVDSSTCPACHYAEISQPSDPSSGKCCPDIVCVEDTQCMCTQREEWKQDCPIPECDEDYEFLVILAEATADSCCPVYTCQRDLTKVCEAKQAAYTYTDFFDNQQTGYVEGDGSGSTADSICGPCQEVTKYRAPNPAEGRCFGTWKCKPKSDKCCESDYFHDAPPGMYPNTGEMLDDNNYKTCEDIANEKATCLAEACEERIELRRPNRNKGRCCTTYACAIQPECVCDNKVCPFSDASAYQALYCPNKSSDPNAPTKQFYKVETIPANPGAGKCCDTYVCRETAAKRIRELRVAKRKAKRATRRSRKSSTTGRR